MSSSEFGNVMRMFGLKTTDFTLKNMVNLFDANKNGTIDFDEFYNMMKQ